MFAQDGARAGADSAWEQRKLEARKMRAALTGGSPQRPAVCPVEHSENGVHHPGDRVGRFVGQSMGIRAMLCIRRTIL